MMKNKTYNNVLRLTKIISKKGYDFDESSKMALNCFDKAEESLYSPEHFASMIISKEQWERETKQCAKINGLCYNSVKII